SVDSLYGLQLESISDVNTYHLNDSSKFTLLNSRLGSRFSLSYISAETGIRTGSSGFDMDENSSLYVGVTIGDKKYCLRTSYLPRNCQYFENQVLTFSPTGMTIKGSTPEGIELVFKLISPFTTSKTLEDEDNLKTQIFPGFYFLVDIKDNSNKGYKGIKLNIGFRQIPVNSFNFMAMRAFRYEKGVQKMY